MVNFHNLVAEWEHLFVDRPIDPDDNYAGDLYIRREQLTIDDTDVYLMVISLVVDCEHIADDAWFRFHFGEFVYAELFRIFAVDGASEATEGFDFVAMRQNTLVEWRMLFVGLLFDDETPTGRAEARFLVRGVRIPF